MCVIQLFGFHIQIKQLYSDVLTFDHSHLLYQVIPLYLNSFLYRCTCILFLNILLIHVHIKLHDKYLYTFEVHVL